MVHVFLSQSTSIPLITSRWKTSPHALKLGLYKSAPPLLGVARVELSFSFDALEIVFVIPHRL